MPTLPIFRRKVPHGPLIHWAVKTGILVVLLILFVFCWYGTPQIRLLRWHPALSLPHNVSESTKLVYNNEDLCQTTGIPENSLKVIIVVLSARENWRERSLIRRTWGSIRNLNGIMIIGVAFMIGHVGESGEKESVSKSLEKESARFKDLISGDFTDTYRNLSVKGMMGFEWITKYCDSADIVVKTDDDVVINVFELARELRSIQVVGQSSIWCLIHYDEVPLREPTGGAARYYVPPDQFPSNKFPNHCAGVGYVTPLSVVQRMVTVFPLIYPVSTHEDVFLTGVVPETMGGVKLVEMRDKWYRWHPNKGVTDEVLSKISIERKYNEVEPFKIFQKAYGTVIFYLIEHSDNFQNEVLQLWNRITMTAILSDEI